MPFKENKRNSCYVHDVIFYFRPEPEPEPVQMRHAQSPQSAEAHPIDESGEPAQAQSSEGKIASM